MRDKIQNVSEVSYLGLFFLCFIANATVLLPAPSLMIAASCALIMNPWLVAYTFFSGKKIKFFKAKDVDGQGLAGQVIRADKKLVIACGSGAIEIFSLQEEGGKAMEAISYLNGRKLKVGDILEAFVMEQIEVK
jgi:hypothetical protein